MVTEVAVSRVFQKRLDHYMRKFPAVLEEVESLIDQLEQDERPGDKVPKVGYDVYKVRVKNPSAKKGKRGGFWVIYYVKVADHVTLITIYPKNERVDISPEEIKKLVEEVIESLKDSE
jgi:mRNA-degrading endonuclease RelE of RelBE toxin-antitoxin system